MGPFGVAVVFLLFLTVSAVAGIVGDYKKRGLALEALRAAIERGQQLDPSVVERLMAPEPETERLNPLHLKVGGIITVAAGVGIALMSWFLAQVTPIALYPVSGAGLVVVCVGVGLLIAAGVVKRHRASAEATGR